MHTCTEVRNVVLETFPAKDKIRAQLGLLGCFAAWHYIIVWNGLKIRAWPYK